jgi:hypothetical protein
MKKGVIMTAVFQTKNKSNMNMLIKIAKQFDITIRYNLEDENGTDRIYEYKFLNSAARAKSKNIAEESKFQAIKLKTKGYKFDREEANAR